MLALSHAPSCSPAPLSRAGVQARQKFLRLRSHEKAALQHEPHTRIVADMLRVYRESKPIDGSWSGAGVGVAETGATLRTFQGMPERPVWSGQFRKSNVARQSGPARQFSRKPALGLNVGNGAQRNSAVQRKRLRASRVSSPDPSTRASPIPPSA